MKLSSFASLITGLEQKEHYQITAVLAPHTHSTHGCTQMLLQSCQGGFHLVWKGNWICSLFLFYPFSFFFFHFHLQLFSSEHIQLELKLFFAIYHCLLHQKADIRRKALLLFIGGSQTLLISLLRLAGSLSTLQDNISSCNWMAECCICR